MRFYNFIKYYAVSLVTLFWNLVASKKVTRFNFSEAKVIFAARSSRWHKVRNDFLKLHNTCAVCGSEKNLVVHHIVPVHIDKSRELDETNLMPLCQNKTMNCHFIFGHLLNWTKSNPNVVEDSRVWNKKLL